MTWFIILEKTPYPGNWQPMHQCHLMSAEWDCQLNKRSYYERALQVGKLGDKLILYTYEDAQRIIASRAARAPYAQHKILRFLPGVGK